MCTFSCASVNSLLSFLISCACFSSAEEYKLDAVDTKLIEEPCTETNQRVIKECRSVPYAFPPYMQRFIIYQRYIYIGTRFLFPNTRIKETKNLNVVITNLPSSFFGMLCLGVFECVGDRGKVLALPGAGLVG